MCWPFLIQLCDDSFEEHVLPYPAHLTGLHLHGLNLNVAPAFVTLSPFEVSSFAREWGFIETKALVMSSLKEVRQFTREVEEKGAWEGEAIEGFVVRCIVGPSGAKSDQAEPDPKALATSAQPSTDIEDGVGRLVLGQQEKHIASPPVVSSVTRSKSDVTASLKPPTSLRSRQLSPPYPPNSTFFFKIKFNQPYLLYRNFREITNILLPLLDAPPISQSPAIDSPVDPQKPPSKPKKIKSVEVPRTKLQDIDSQAYERWCRESMVQHPEWFQGISRGKGIVAARERFLEWKLSEEGRSVYNQLALELRKKGKVVPGEVRGDRGKDGWGKTLIVPIAVPGCGALVS